VEANRVTQDETPTKPTRRPYAMSLENGLRRVRTNSVEHDALVGAGYVVVEQDDEDTILRLARRATDRATVGDLNRWRRIEEQTLEGLAADLHAHGVNVDAGQLRWVLDEFRTRIMRETKSPRTVVSGRLR
jgi:hypothetical protein